jgi:hypothetical protein
VTGRFWRVLRGAVADPRHFVDRLRLTADLAGLRLSNRLSRRRVTGSGPAVVNLTSYGHRVQSVYYAVESIARARVRPRRLILWLDDPAVLADPPAELVRLRSRGLELLACPDYGPHKKQFAYATSIRADHGAPKLPLVVADDDVLYPRGWLAQLLDAHRRHPEDVHGHRTHRIGFRDGAVAPYSDWTPGHGTEAGYTVFCTGVSGILYPPALVSALADEGDAFLQRAPHADDVWVHSVMVRHGFRGRQVSGAQAEYPAIPGTQRDTLYGRNVRGGGNDSQIKACFGAAELDRMRHDDVGAESGAPAG